MLGLLVMANAPNDMTERIFWQWKYRHTYISIQIPLKWDYTEDWEISILEKKNMSSSNVLND